MFDEKPEAQQRAELAAEQGIDSLRRALSVADERVREQAEEIEAHKRARLALGEVLAEIAGIVGVDPKRQSGDELIAEVRRIVDARQTTEGRHGH